MRKFLVILFAMLAITGCGATNETKDGNSALENVKEEAYTLTSDQEFKLAIIIKNISFSKKFEFNKLSDKEKLQLIYFIARAEQYKDGNHSYSEDYLNKKNFEMITREYFGPDAKITMGDIPCCDTAIYLYDETTGTYHMNEMHGGHGYSDRQIIKKLVDVTKKGDVVTVKYKMGFSSYVDIGAPEGFYTSIESAKENYMTPDIPFYSYCWGDDITYDCDYDKMIDENDFTEYSFNFKLDGDNFYFIGYTNK